MEFSNPLFGYEMQRRRHTKYLYIVRKDLRNISCGAIFFMGDVNVTL